MLLLNAMRETGRAALGRFVLAGKEKLVPDPRPRRRARARDAVPRRGRLLAGRDRGGRRRTSSVKKPELALAQQVIESLAGDFDPSALTSDYRRDLKAMLEAKLAGAEIVAAGAGREEAPVIDLMEALRKSVAEARSAARTAPRRRKPPRRAALEPVARPAARAPDHVAVASAPAAWRPSAWSCAWNSVLSILPW